MKENTTTGPVNGPAFQNEEIPFNPPPMRADDATLRDLIALNMLHYVTGDFESGEELAEHCYHLADCWMEVRNR